MGNHLYHLVYHHHHYPMAQGLDTHSIANRILYHPEMGRHQSRCDTRHRRYLGSHAVQDLHYLGIDRCCSAHRHRHYLE